MATAAPSRSTATLVRSTLVVVAVRGLDFLLSFMVSVLLAGRFGVGGQLDAFFLARRTTVGFADTIRKLVAQVVMPSVVQKIDRGERLSVHGLPKQIYFFIAGFAVITLAGTFIPSFLVTIFAPGFSGERHDLTATMMTIMMPLLALAVVSSLLVAVLQANRRYLLSEGTNVIQRAMLVLVLALAVPPLGIVAGAWTMLIGGIVGTIILIVGAWSIIRRRPSALLRGESGDQPTDTESDVPQLGGGVAAAIVLNIYFQATSLLDFAVASLLPEGGVASLEYGARLVSLVPGLLMSSLYTVLLPELIRAVQAKDRDPDALARYQRMAIFAQIPVSIGMMLGAELIVRILFARGAFGETSVMITAGTAAGYAAAAIFLAPMSAITSAIYADPRAACMRDIVTIAIVGIVLRGIGLAIGAPIGGAAGIAWAAAASTLAAGLVAQRIARRRFADLRVGPHRDEVLRMALAGGVAAAAGWLLLWIIPMPAPLIGKLALLIALGAAVVAGYGTAAILLHLPEVVRLRAIMATVIGRKLGRR